ncbi:unnamed protein product [Linum tenue]|uniref:Uncharacterized protein n=1 Tax=Linum tenue TaxID=586396 RepID=A0AAV0IDM7_9ROSI|nr:unnamed protein product [Linum tenue]
MILTNLFFYLIPLVSVMFAGHLGELHLAGATLANSWATVTGFAFMVQNQFSPFPPPILPNQVGFCLLKLALFPPPPPPPPAIVDRAKLRSCTESWGSISKLPASYHSSSLSQFL